MAPGEDRNLVVTYEKRNSDLGVFNCLLVRDQEHAKKIKYDSKYRSLGAAYLFYDIMLMAANLQQPLIQQVRLSLYVLLYNDVDTRVRMYVCSRYVQYEVFLV